MDFKREIADLVGWVFLKMCDRMKSAELKDHATCGWGINQPLELRRFRHATCSSWLQAKTAVAPQGAGLVPST
ncbi:MAG: hypothetical protein V7K94_16470 [Nostoc sp.]|uniref:hypothetical protein n=1 Tax=Nostoc sp. TaxID=1180 RepID=UPI002FF9EFC0